MRTTLGQALAAYAAAAAHGRAKPAPVAPQAAAVPSFAALVRDEVASAVGALSRGEATAVAGLTGKASVQQVVEAVSTAELSLQKVTAVRDRVIAAYQEIVRMPI